MLENHAAYAMMDRAIAAPTPGLYAVREPDGTGTLIEVVGTTLRPAKRQGCAGLFEVSVQCVFPTSSGRRPLRASLSVAGWSRCGARPLHAGA